MLKEADRVPGRTDHPCGLQRLRQDNDYKEYQGTEGIPCYTFDNLTEGGSRSVSEAISSNDIAWAATAWRSSEGENISMHVAKMAANMRRFLETGNTPRSLRSKKWAKLFNDGKEEEKPVPDERWILLDAVDSGYSIDNIIELKDSSGSLWKRQKGSAESFTS